jgi:transcription initiation factor TFIIE subunit beta
LGEEILFVTRPHDKKKVLFYNDKACSFQVDDEFQKLWRAAAVDGMDDEKIEEYLEKHVRAFCFLSRDHSSTARITDVYITTGYVFAHSLHLFIIFLDFRFVFSQGIKSMQDQGPRKVAPVVKRKAVRKKSNRYKKPRDNEHVSDLLKVYDT